MTINKLRKDLNESISDAVQRSDIDISSMPKDQKEKLIEEISNAVLLAFDSYISESSEENSSEDIPIDSDEEILWKGRPFLSLTESYVITSERIKLITGFLARNVENFELIRVQDIDYKQNIGERIMGLGDITVRGHDPSDPSIVLRNIPKPEEVYELLRRSWLQARKKHGLQFREYM